MRRTTLTLLSLFALVLAVMAPVGSAGAAQPNAGLGLGQLKGDVAVSPTGSYIVVMNEEPLVAEFGQDGLDSKQAKAKGKALAKGHDKVLAEAGASASDKVNTYINAVSGFSAIISHEEAQAIANRDDVFAVYPDELRQPTTDTSGDFLGLTDQAGAWATQYDGEGVVIGVIDSGIWPEHPSFADDGSYKAPNTPSIPCDFGNSGHHAEDAAFDCNNKLIGARQVLPTYRALIGAESFEFDSARDENGHGTHTASTAGGNAGVEAQIFGVDRGTISGVAPRAHIVAYKALGTLGGFSSDLAAAIDQAVLDGVDVINYSIGSSSFAIGADDVAFLFAANAGVYVATSNGNSGPGAATTGSPASVPWLTSVGASTHNRTFQGSAVLGNGDAYYGASVTAGVGPLPLVDSEDLGNELCTLSGTFNEDISGKIVLCRRGAVARVEKGEAVFNAGGAGMILYNQNDGQSLVTDNHFLPSVHINNTDGVAVKAYIDDAGAAATAEVTAGESTPTQGSVMAGFSSRGPNRLSADIIKPDVTAPGVNILAGNTPVIEPGNVPGELFQSISGTSMSSPHVAGVFALIKQAHPDWSAAMAKSAIMTTSRQDVTKEDAATAADPFDMGAGHIAPGARVHKGSAFQPGLTYDAGLFEYAAFTCGAELGVFSPGSCGFLDSIGVPSDASDLNLPSIGIADLAGSQTVTRTVTSVADEKGWRTYTVSVDAPAGYDVEVSPSTFSIKSGQSASYEVTITNNGDGPVGEWRFGSLTWEDQTGLYSVYSPIAVKAAQIDAPDLVEGTGTDGSTSFDILFGYTGDYSAAAHGLIAQTDLTGTIGQDPDQTYPSGDDVVGPGEGVNKFDLVVAGSAYIRFELDIPGDDDIDLFLEDSGGNIVAQSTNGGTHEVVELFFPADDTYTMVVHGWSVPSAPLDYTMLYWDISATPGGSLSIDSAPASAVAAQTGTIDISWAGLAPGLRYFGAVSHSDADGVFELTFVRVDT